MASWQRPSRGLLMASPTLSKGWRAPRTSSTAHPAPPPQQAPPHQQPPQRLARLHQQLQPQLVHQRLGSQPQLQLMLLAYQLPVARQARRPPHLQLPPILLQLLLGQGQVPQQELQEAGPASLHPLSSESSSSCRTDHEKPVQQNCHSQVSEDQQEQGLQCPCEMMSSSFMHTDASWPHCCAWGLKNQSKETCRRLFWL